MAELTVAAVGGLIQVDRNISPVDPATQLTAAQVLAVNQAAIQNSRTGPRWLLKFSTNTGTGYPVTLVHDSDFSVRSHWGTGSGVFKMEKTAANTYELTFTSPQTDLLGASEVITVDPVPWAPHAWSSTAADDVHAKIVAVSGNMVTIRTESARGTGADVGDSSAAVFNVELAVP